MPNTTEHDRIGAVVVEVATAAGMSLNQLADAAGIPASTLSRSTRGLRPFRIDELARIASALGTTGTDLMMRAAA